jgi:hypothetical protein
MPLTPPFEQRSAAAGFGPALSSGFAEPIPQALPAANRMLWKNDSTPFVRIPGQSLGSLLEILRQFCREVRAGWRS